MTIYHQMTMKFMRQTSVENLRKFCALVPDTAMIDIDVDKPSNPTPYDSGGMVEVTASWEEESNDDVKVTPHVQVNDQDEW